MAEHAFLLPGEFRDVFRLQPVSNLGITSQRSSAGTWRIKKHAIERRRRKGKWLHCIVTQHVNASALPCGKSAHRLDAVLIQVAGNDSGRWLDRCDVRRFASGRGGDVQHALIGFDLKQMRQ